jgi:hypothetical protein
MKIFPSTFWLITSYCDDETEYWISEGRTEKEAVDKLETMNAYYPLHVTARKLDLSKLCFITATEHRTVS